MLPHTRPGDLIIENISDQSGMTQERPRRFGYHRTKMKVYMVFVLIAWLVGVVAWPIAAKPEGWIDAELWFSIPGFVFLFLLTVNFFLLTSDILASANTISRELFGVEWKRINWADVRRIRILTIWDYERLRRIKVYCLDREDRPHSYFLPRGGISFNERIESFDELVRLTREQAAQRAIPIIDESLPDF